MKDILRLREHYQTQPPRLSFEGSEPLVMQTKVFDTKPESERTKSLGVEVWCCQSPASPNVNLPDGYCVVDVCLDSFGSNTPDTLPLPLEMKNHDLELVVFVDAIGCIRMRAIGQYSGLKETES